jgi:hypothetical protein
MIQYPELEEIWNRKIAYLDEREALEKIEAARRELAVKRGKLGEFESFERGEALFDETMRGEEEFATEFQAECHRLTGTH